MDVKVAYGIVGAAALCAGFAGGLVAAPHLFPQAVEPGEGWVDLSVLPDDLIEQHRTTAYLENEIKSAEMSKRMLEEMAAEKAARADIKLPEGVPSFPGGRLVEAPSSADWPDIAPEGDTGGAFAAAKDGWVVINIWATWCAPCVKELPDMDAGAPRLAEAGVTLLAIDADMSRNDTLADVEAVYRKRGVKSLAPLFAAGSDANALLIASGQTVGAQYPTNIVYRPGGEPYALFYQMPDDRTGIWSSDEMIAFFAALTESGG
ncbi:TlpA disulfide reductase family protein [Hyphomonas johnsonii]|uniref:Putative thiol-disulfide isomerase n=1 Tax=Hyphomonas johnsonii MHS-2 TaxID=1280950 RepID=A0A059FJI2_9PROT|nr:TlpA disulfide reductase family protein [Hyphomonas johnsonii]KCZ90691.1 putative thiol-disulfide isomerase [Hyphomonas johnsonii MHS-2]